MNLSMNIRNYEKSALVIENLAHHPQLTDKINNVVIKFQTEEQLNVPPETRGRRSVKDDILLGTRDANGLVRGCEDTDFLGFGDVSTFPEDIASRIEDQRECKVQLIWDLSILLFITKLDILLEIITIV